MKTDSTYELMGIGEQATWIGVRSSCARLPNVSRSSARPNCAARPTSRLGICCLSSGISSLTPVYLLRLFDFRRNSESFAKQDQP
jgi:hypothetical protein